MALDPISAISSTSQAASDPRERAPFVASIGGKTYIANVNESAGVFTAEDPAVFGAVGSGPTLQTAEEEFANRINVLA
jgi:hypothetical protein